MICSPELRGAIEKPLKDFCKQRCVEKDMDESVMGVDYLPVPSETNFVYFKHKLLTHLQSTLGDLCAQKNIITYALNKEDSPSRQYVSKRTSEALVLKMQEVIHLARVNQSVIDALINDFDALFLHGEGLESFFAESVFSTFIRFYVVHLSQLLRENKVQAAKESCLQLLKKFNDYTQKYGPEFKTAVAALLLHMGEAYRDKKGLECFGHMLLEQSQNIQPDGSLKKRILISLNALVNPTETGLKKLCELPELQRQPRFQAVQEAIHRAKRTFFQSATGVSLLFTTPHEKASPPQACAASPAPRAGNA